MKPYQTPSEISLAKYCERAGAISKLFPYGGFRSVATVLGNVEHAAFQEFYNLFRIAALKDDIEILTTDDAPHKTRLNKVLEYVVSFYTGNYPTYHQHILDEIPSIRFRLDYHYQQKLDEIKGLIKKPKVSFTQAVSRTLPFEIEQSLNAYNIHGRVDCIYHGPNDSKGNPTLIAEDLKSHSSKFSCLIHKPSFKAQLTCYAILIEAIYKKRVHYGRIFYTKDCSYDVYKITNKDKIEILKVKDKLQAVLDNGLPPVIDDQLKCDNCYKQNLCKKISEEGITEPTKYVSLDVDEDEGDQN